MNREDDFPEPNSPSFPVNAWLEAEIPVGLEASVLKACARAQRHRRWRRSGLRSLCVVALFLGGVIFERLSNRTSALEQVLLADTPIADSPPEISPILLSPDALRMQAELEPGPSQGEMFRRAGDEYLRGQYDVQTAMHCYHQYLALLSKEDQRAVKNEDTWLLASLRRTL